MAKSALKFALKNKKNKKNTTCTLKTLWLPFSLSRNEKGIWQFKEDDSIWSLCIDGSWQKLCQYERNDSPDKKNTMSEMSVGRQKCQLDVKNVSWTSSDQITSDQTNRSDQIRSDSRKKNNVTEKRVTESHRIYILECGEDITSVSRARKGS